jgi:ParB/Sulfiredoxin domain
LTLEGTGYGLSIRNVDALCPHERVIERNVESLEKELIVDGVQKDPVIVDRDSGAILDGMHRLAAFKRLGLGRVVCCEVDYGSKDVILKRWARTYAIRDEEGFIGAMRDIGMGAECTWQEAVGLLEARAAALAVFLDGRAYVAEGPADLEHAFALVDEIDRLSERKGWTREYVPEDDLERLVKGEGVAVSLVQRLTKDDVIGAAVSAKLFPCKTSMHTVDPRPVAVRFPIDELKDATADSLSRWLGGKPRKLLPGGSTYEGRRYKERLLVIGN